MTNSPFVMTNSHVVLNHKHVTVCSSIVCVTNYAVFITSAHSSRWSKWRPGPSARVFNGLL